MSTESNNPYASPIQATLHPQIDKPPHQELASQGQRFLNFFIDGIIIRIISFGVGLVVGIVFVSANGVQLTEAEAAFLNIVAMIVALIAIVLYFFVMEAACGRTIGKLITGTMVTTSDGSPPSVGQLFGRSLARLIPFEPFSFLGKQPPVGWHDSLSGTRVVKTR